MSGSAQLTPEVSVRDHIQGDENAPITLVEFGDYQCPYCGAAYPEIKRLQNSLGNNLRFVFRNFPLTQAHPYALIAAEAAEAAAQQDKFWEMHDIIFENQDDLAPEQLAAWAEQAALNVEEFATAIRSEVVSSRIKKDRASGIHSGVNGTPTLFINGARYDGMPDYASLREAITGEV